MGLPKHSLIGLTTIRSTSADVTRSHVWYLVIQSCKYCMPNSKLQLRTTAGVQFSLSERLNVVCSILQIGLLDAAKHDQYVLDVAAGVAATEDEAWQNMQLCTTHDGKALLMQCGFEQASADVQYCVQFHSQPSTVRLDCCIRDNSQSLRLGPRGMLKVLARVCHKDTKQVLARLVSTSFNVTSSRSKYNRNGSALPLLQSDPVGRLRGVGAETEKRLLDPHGFVMYYQVTEDDTVLPPHCVAYLASVTTVGDFKELEVWMDREWPECPRALRNALLPPSAIDQLELSPALPKDERMRRWRSSYGQELLFAAKQAVVSAQNLTAVAEPVSCYGQQTMKITAISRFDTDLADRVERLQGTAMEQLFGDNHLGWDVPGAHSSLFSFLDEIPAGDSVRVPISDYEKLLHGSPLPPQQPPAVPSLLYKAPLSVPSLPPQAMTPQSAMAAFQCSPLSTCHSSFVAPQPSPFAACQASQPVLQLRSFEAFQPAPPNTFQTSLPIAHQSVYANITEAPQPDASWPDCYLSSPPASGMSEHDERRTPSCTMPDSLCGVELGTADLLPEEEEDTAAEGSNAGSVCIDDQLLLPAPSTNFLDKYLGDADDMWYQEDMWHQEEHGGSCTCDPDAASTLSCQLAPVQPHWSQHAVPDIVRHIAQDVMGAVKGLFDMSQLQDALCAVYISTSSRGDPRLKWQEIRLNKASDLGHCICLDGDPDFGLNHEGDPHCLARVPRGRGGYRFARSRAGLISAHFEYKDREFAAHEFEIVTNLHEFVWRRASPSFTGAIEVGRDSKGRPTYAAMCKSTHGVEGSSSRPHHYIPGRAQAHLSYAAYCWASCGYKADLSDCYVLCQR
ncbi:TPA: hypothetical protein ACH3X2_001738 [Trebouxia sp. C0005]